jgi:trehalose-phosphatase
LIIIEQEGIIPMKTSDDIKPDPTFVKALNEISKLPENMVFVVSRESKQQMHAWYADKAPFLGLAAENGFFWRWNSTNRGINDWQELFQFEDFNWIRQVQHIMEMYNEKTEGAFIETKESNIIWNFENTEYEYGRMQAKELKSYIEQVFKNLPIIVNEYKTFI